MKIGTKSVLYGAHFFLTHWLFVAAGWWQVYGLRRVAIGEKAFWDYLEQNDGHRYPASYRRVVFTRLWDPRLWIAFMIHDLGYWGKPNMDGPEGELHPVWAARVMGRLFGEHWHHFCRYHSRFLAKQEGNRPSPLCYADKLAIALEPWWYYLPRVNLTGEIKEYMAKSSSMNATGDKYSGMNLRVSSQRAWHRDMCAYVRLWVDHHKDGREDEWTPLVKNGLEEKEGRRVVTSTGVWQ